MKEQIQRQAMGAALRNLIQSGKGVSAVTALEMLKKTGMADDDVIAKAEQYYKPTETQETDEVHETELTREEFIDSILGFLQKGKAAGVSYQETAVAVVRTAGELTKIQNSEAQPDAVGKLVTPQAGTAVGAHAEKEKQPSVSHEGPNGPSLG